MYTKLDHVLFEYVYNNIANDKYNKRLFIYSEIYVLRLIEFFISKEEYEKCSVLKRYLDLNI